MLDQPPCDVAWRCTTDARRACPRGQGAQCHNPGILFPAAAPALKVAGLLTRGTHAATHPNQKNIAARAPRPHRI
eukprot:4600674-Lingulodinium_polyedra.AAC.1